MLRRLLLIPLMIAIACVLSGTYGMVHNQVTYTISPEYFTKFKFIQIDLESQRPDRVSASIVGWHASWWMGVVVSYLLIPLGLLIRGNAHYCFGMLRVFAVVALTTFLFGLVAFGYALVTVDGSSLGRIMIYGNEIDDRVSFEQVGILHDFDYVGGYAGMLTGTMAIFWGTPAVNPGRRRVITPTRGRATTHAPTIMSQSLASSGNQETSR